MRVRHRNNQADLDMNNFLRKPNARPLGQIGYLGSGGWGTGGWQSSVPVEGAVADGGEWLG